MILNGTQKKEIQSISKDIECFVGDIRHKESLKPFFSNSKGSVLFHLAGIIHPKKLNDLYDVNSWGLKNVLEIASNSKVKRVVVISSNSPVGCNIDNDHLFNELDDYNPYMTYGKSKKLAEEITNSYYKSGKIETVILRPCWFYGPNQPVRQTLFFDMVKNGKMPIVGNGRNKRSMSYVDNTCQALLLARQVDKANGQTYWIADERPYSMNEIIDTVKELLKNEFGFMVAKNNLRIPSIASEVAYIMDYSLQAFGLYNQKIHVLSEMNKTIACSIDKAKNELNYNPKISLEEGMRQSISWCIKNGYLQNKI